MQKRADARRNEAALLDAAAAVFVGSGVDAPVREIAAKAGVGVATIYRHFPTRGDLILAVFRHQVVACAEAGPILLADKTSPFDALTAWVDMYVDFLATKHGLPEAMHADTEGLHRYFVDTLVPVCGDLLTAAADAGEIVDDQQPIELMRAVGNLCFGATDDSQYDARRMVGVLLQGLRIR
ncbi:TetR family transcriptional regulator [Rhodococcoides trifolii]|uniref:TetR family transcriptional regulator n=1 Tax=Rhodococcoides trifolii TaxID=908250 RepID=A0A917CXB1_9NOCA|nr:TetR/AcrR family transcriptional regulator [Rhodococcus trifolii]GGF98730.1 TetR family transcriptional regulator [Rhodococcus trifolii]